MGGRTEMMNFMRQFAIEFDEDRIKLLEQYSRDEEEVIKRQEDRLANADLTEQHWAESMRKMLLEDVETIHNWRYQELLDENERPDHLDPYTYTPLPDATHIRLLRLKDEFDVEAYLQCRTIFCELIIVKLDEAPEYEALSYTWGTREKTVPIKVSNKQLLVTPNLAIVLQYLRGKVDGKSKELFWVDQLCIDQSNHDERGQQVRIMRNIYQKASRTTIWLGLHSQSFLRVKDRLLSKVWQQIKKNPETSLLPDFSVARTTPNNLPGFDDEIWSDLVEFLQRPWFRRIWVVQEARASVRQANISVQIGKVSVGWHYLGMILTWLQQKGFSSVDKRLKAALFPARIFNCGNQERVPLLVQLQETRQFEASDPRDKIFALIGLVEEGEDGEDLPDCLRPDYSKSVREVYQSVTIYLVKKYLDLRVFSYVQHVTSDIVADIDLHVSEPSDKMPSWVVRWESEHAIGSPIIDCAHWKASGDKPIDIKIFKRTAALKVRGIYFDKITYCSDIFQNWNCITDEEVLALRNPVLSAWRQAGDHYSKYPTGESTEEVFMITTLCGRRVLGERLKSDDELLLAFYAYLHYAFIMRQCYSTFERQRLVNSNISIHKRVKNTPNPISSAEPGSAIDVFHRTFGSLGAGRDPTLYERELSFARQRKVFSTLMKYVGMGPAAMRKGDIVCILFGGRVPYVLRPHDDHYELIGECYVHGLMDGEALEIAEKKGVKADYFELR